MRRLLASAAQRRRAAAILRSMDLRTVLCCGLAFLLAACVGAPPAPERGVVAPVDRVAFSEKGNEITLFALGLIDTGYRFGGKNPQAGLDCSGMVSYIYHQGAGLKVSGSAAEIARKGRPIERGSLRPGDLVFFNTRNAPFSHVGLYIGEDRFVHAPSGSGRVRIDHLNARYYAQRFEAARSYFD
jgi:cell wall-associated NlpC family hydrolase